MAETSTRYNRNTLYEQVWSQPVSQLAKAYGISDVALHKICLRLRVPVPGRRYWEKVRHGYTVKKTALPPLRDGQASEITSSHRSGPAGTGEPLQRTERIQVPEQLVDPHPLVAAVVPSLRGGRQEETGLVRSRTPGRLDIRVSRSSLDRAARIMDALIRAIDAHELAVSIGTEDSHPTKIQVGEEVLTLRLEEQLDRSERKLIKAQEADKIKNPWRYSTPEYDYAPSGRLAVSIGSVEGTGCRQTWADGGKQRLENCLHRVVDGLLKAAAVAKARRLERERWNREWDEKQRGREEEERRWREGKARREALDGHLVDRQKAIAIREYVAAVRADREIKEDNKLDLWLKWASGFADELDPKTHGSLAAEGLAPARSRGSGAMVRGGMRRGRPR